jgi:hypothetical protein
VPLIATALQGLIGPRATEVLPNLCDLFLGGSAMPGTVPEAMQPFVTTRRLSGQPVAVHHWEGSKQIGDSLVSSAFHTSHTLSTYLVTAHCCHLLPVRGHPFHLLLTSPSHSPVPNARALPRNGYVNALSVLLSKSLCVSPKSLPRFV